MPLSYSSLLGKTLPTTPLSVVGNLAGNLYDAYKIATKPAPSPMGMVSGALSGAAASVPAPQKPVVAAPPTSSGNKNSSISAGNTSYYGNNYNAGNTQNKTSAPAATTNNNDQLGANSSPTPSQNSENSQNNDVFNLDNLKKLYGVTDIPTYRAPDTSTYDKKINSFDPEAEKARIQDQLDAELSNIENRYAAEAKDAEVQTENERQSQLSNLYNIGYVNPASSGVSSIGLASKDVLNKRKDAINQAKQAERSAAIKQAYGLKSDVEQKALTLAQQQKANVEKQAADSYANDRQKWTDSVSQINNIVNLYKSGKQIQKDDQDQAQKNITMLLTSFGSQAFEGVDQNEISSMEKAAGLPAGTLVRGLKTLKEKELTSKNGVNGLNLKEINGSLYNVKTDAYGNVVPELIIKGAGKVSDNLVKINGVDYVQNADGTYSLPNIPQQSNQASELKTNALTTAQSLLQKFNEGKGTSAVGKSGTLDSFGYGLIPGTDRANFVNDFNSLKSLLSLENVKLLKGQGAVSDSERALLEKASTKLNLSQSEDEFKSTLNDLVKSLSNQNNQQGMSLEDLAQKNGYDPSEIQILRKMGKSDDAIRSLLQGSSFNKPLSMGQNGSIAPQIAQKYPEGAKGGQCTTFLHSLVQFPAIGDGKLQKFASVDKFGITADQLRQNPRIGDVIVTGENKTYGHTAMINAILPNGFRVTESNFRGDERVTHDRIIPFNSPQIYGAIRGPLKV